MVKGVTDVGGLRDIFRQRHAPSTVPVPRGYPRSILRAEVHLDGQGKSSTSEGGSHTGVELSKLGGGGEERVRSDRMGNGEVRQRGGRARLMRRSGERVGASAAA